jgi:hypothetical protein
VNWRGVGGGCLWCGPGSGQAVPPERAGTLAARVGVRVEDAKGRARRWLLTVLSVTYVAVATTAMSMVYCQPTVMPLRQYLTGMEGDGTSATAAGLPHSTALLQPCVGPGCAIAARRLLNSPLTVSVLGVDPFVVCYEGAHRPVAALAWAVLAVFVAMYPAALVVYVARRIDTIMRLSDRAHQWRKLFPDPVGAGGSGPCAWRAVLRAQWVILVCRRPWRRLRPVEVVLAREVDESAPVLTDPTLAAFTGGVVRPHAFWLESVDLVLRCVISVPLVVWSAPRTASEATSKFVLTAVALVASAALFVQQRPYKEDMTHLLPVKVFSLLVCAVAAATNLLTFLAATGAASAAAFTAVATTSAALSLALLGFAVLAFLTTLVRGAGLSKLQEQLVRAARSSFAISAANPLFKPGSGAPPPAVVGTANALRVASASGKARVAVVAARRKSMALPDTGAATATALTMHRSPLIAAGALAVAGGPTPGAGATPSPWAPRHLAAMKPGPAGRGAKPKPLAPGQSARRASFAPTLAAAAGSGVGLSRAAPGARKPVSLSRLRSSTTRGPRLAHMGLGGTASSSRSDDSSLSGGEESGEGGRRRTASRAAASLGRHTPDPTGGGSDDGRDSADDAV